MCWAEVTAKSIVIDAEAAARRDPCAILARIAQIKKSSADIPLFKVFREHGLVLPVNFSYAKVGKTERYPYIKPSHLLEVVGEDYLHKVLGVPVHLAENSLVNFWEKFRGLHPQHQVFQQYFSLESLVPFYLHGDGGTGYKKESVEILSMLPALGAGSKKRPVDLGRKRKSNDDELHGMNLRGNSGATRFLFTVLSSLVLKKDKGMFDDLMLLWGQELHALLADGFQAHGKRWHVVILGFTGDSPYAKKIGDFSRSFNNVRKTHSSKRRQKGCCWLCHAGYEFEDVHIPFEHLGFSSPLWLQTRKLQNPLPWEGEGGALLHYMLMDSADTPAAFFRPDFFHVYWAGVGKDFAASALIYSMKKLYGLGSVAKDLAALNEELRLWMRSQKSKLHCGSLTEDLLGYSGSREYPEGKWNKGSDTAVVMKFVVHLLQKNEFRDQVAGDGILQKILESALQMGSVLRTCFMADYFLSDEQCQVIINAGHLFLMGYASLVSMCYKQSLCLFKLRPKIHYLNHIFLRVLDEWTLAGTAVNPCAEATFMSEDFVGRTARLTRRVDPRAIAQKTLQRYLCWMETALDKDLVPNLDFGD